MVLLIMAANTGTTDSADSAGSAAAMLEMLVLLVIMVELVQPLILAIQLLPTIGRLVLRILPTSAEAFRPQDA